VRNRLPAFKMTHRVAGDKIASLHRFNQNTLESGGVSMNMDDIYSLCYLVISVNYFNPV